MTTDNSGQIDFMHWLIRLIAYIIDAVIISIVSFIIGIILAAVIVLSGAFFLFVGYWLFLLTFGILSILYFIILDVYWGATIGKRVMGLQVQIGKRRQDINRQIIHSQYKQNLRTFPFS